MVDSVTLSDETKSREQLIEELRVLRARLEEETARNRRPPEAAGRQPREPLDRPPAAGGAIEGEEHAEEVLRSEEERFHKVVTNAPIPILVYDETGAVRAVSRTLTQLTGYREEELRTMEDWLERAYRADPDHMEDVRRRMRQAFVHGHPLPLVERPISTRSGEKRVWLFAQAEAVRLQDGQSFLTAMAVDVTERKKAEEALRESESRFRSVLENSLDAVYRRNLQTDRYEYMSPVIRRITGFSAEEMSAMGIREVQARVHPDDLPALKAAMRRADHTGRGKLEYRFRGKDGRTRWLADYITVLKDPEGKPLYRSGIVREVTRLKRDEQALRELNEELERRVAERSAMAEARARQLQALSVRLLEAEERERERIAGILHDDLQQILGAVKRKLYWLKPAPGSEPVLEDLSQLIEKSIVTSRRLSYELSPAVLHYSGLLPSLEWLARHTLERHGLEVEIETSRWEDGEGKPVKVLLFRAVQELLFNVVKHAGVKKALVRLSRTKEEGLWVTVSDAGRGFDPHILDPGPGAVGIGLLSIRERLISAGGTLHIESADGQGSRFTMTVPPVLAGHEAPDPWQDPERSRETPAAPQTLSTGGCRVLFVDDHKLVRQGLISMLAGQPGIEVVGEAADGVEALEMAQDVHPDVIVMDIAMPRMDGIEATRRIRAELPEVRVIGLSMIEEPEVIERMLQAGAERCVSKAGSSASILQAIYGIADRP